MANTKQTFSVAGITTRNGITKVRFSNDIVRRIKQFSKNKGEAAPRYSRIDLIELPNEMTKIEALKYLATHADFQSPADQATIADTLADKEKEANKGQVKVKANKPSLDAIKARGKNVTAEDVLAAVADTQ